jgi:putative transposase
MWRVPQNRKLSDVTFFVTASLLRRSPIFGQTKAAQIALDSLQFFRKRGEIILYGYVIMPDHVHFVARILVPHTLPDIMRRFKNFVAHELSKGPIWEKGYISAAIPNEIVYAQKLNYLHYNPVKAGLVTEAEQFEFSSAKEYSKGEPYQTIDS